MPSDPLEDLAGILRRTSGATVTISRELARAIISRQPCHASEYFDGGMPGVRVYCTLQAAHASVHRAGKHTWSR